MNNLEWALRYYRAGWLIFPCKDKRPHFQALAPWGSGWKWINKLSLTEEIVKSWWQEFPDAQIALICGKESGITVLDIDWFKLPNTNQPDLENSVDPAVLADNLPVAMMSVTGGRGRHVFYRYTDVLNSVKLLHLQMDVKSEGGYVILPPSNHQSGYSYRWDEAFPWSEFSLRKLPGLPIGSPLLAGPTEGVKRKNWLQIIRGVSQGSRNETAASLAGKLLCSLSPHLAWEIVDLWNQHRNQPPLSQEELSTIFTSILKREYGKPSKHGRRN